MAESIPDRLRIAPSGTADPLSDDPASTPGWDGRRDEAEAAFATERQHLAELQDLLHADGRSRLLLVLQAMDTGGKDGTIRHVLGAVDPIGVRVRSFGRPDGAELAHDFLWRVHAEVPAAGELVVFNRSHYEDVLVTRVHGHIDDDTARRRFEHIRAFERLLVDEGTTIVKCFLSISRDEQARRLRARLDDPTKRWKFDIRDLDERSRWDDHHQAISEAIRATSTPEAPWYVVPADRKWYRNLAVCRILIDTLAGMPLRYPDFDGDPSSIVIE